MLRVWREDDMQEQVREWLEQGKVDIFLGYKKIQGHPLPHCFTRVGKNGHKNRYRT